MTTCGFVTISILRLFHGSWDLFSHGKLPITLRPVVVMFNASEAEAV